MTESDSSPGPIQELTASRARFVAELGERLTVLRQGLARVANTTESGADLNSVRRRMHALAAAADVLRFTSTAEALGLAEAALGAPQQAPSAAARERVGRILDLVPSLVLGAVVEIERALDSEPERALREPLCIGVFAGPALEALLHKAGPLHAPETHRSDDPAQIVDLVARLSPDVLVVDGDLEATAELLPRLRRASGPRVPVIAVGSFERHEPLLRLIRRGATRVLPSPVEAGTLQRTVRQASALQLSEPAEPARFQRLSAQELVAAISVEAARAFAADGPPERDAPIFDFGSGTEVLAALWAAFARIRGLAMAASDGSVRFPQSGPNGAIPLAPRKSAAEPARVRAGREDSILAGRKLLVSASDVGVCTLLSRTLEQLGARVTSTQGGLRALELAERDWPDAVVVDATLPDLDGFELCRRLRLNLLLRDIPVAIVTWKDDLLDRARHVDGALDSAAGAIDPWSLASELGEALLPRARLEKRLAEHTGIGGRLDGLTPRLLLQLACARAPNTLLSLHNGSLRFELTLRDGRVINARAFEAQVERATGSAALRPFLGMRAGRFELTPQGGSARVELDGDLMTLLQPVVASAARARDLVESARLDEVERVVLDPLATAAYLEDSGGTHRSIVARLSSGQAPRSLAPLRGWSDSAARSPLESTLLDLAQRGAVTSLFDAAGRDLIAADASATTAHDTRPKSAPPAAAAGVGLLDLGEVVRQAVSRTPEPLPAAPLPAAPAAIASEPPPKATDGAPAPASLERSESAPPHAPEEPTRPATERAPVRITRAEHGGFFDDSSPRRGAAPEQNVHADPDDADVAAAELSGREEAGDDDEPWPLSSPSARLRSAAVPLVVTLGAASLAFFAVRALSEGGWQTLSGALRGSEIAARDAGVRAASPLETKSSATSSPSVPEIASDDANLLAEQRKVPVDVAFESELMQVPLQARLRPGQGLLEVRTWERQQIYVDGVFMGNYENRLVPLNPGTYQVRLRDGGRHIERAVEVRAGQRTRLTARPKSPRSP